MGAPAHRQRGRCLLLLQLLCHAGWAGNARAGPAKYQLRRKVPAEAEVEAVEAEAEDDDGEAEALDPETEALLGVTKQMGYSAGLGLAPSQVLAPGGVKSLVHHPVYCISVFL
jgi:hypothetical protein